MNRLKLITRLHKFRNYHDIRETITPIRERMILAMLSVCSD